jgi:hypothetical protein
MRPIVSHLADENMETGLRAFFRRQDWHYALRCARFEIDSESSADIFRIGGCTDQGLWKRAHENLATHLKTHERVIVIIDEHFTPSPGAIQIHDDIVRDLFDSGWQRDLFEVIVIQPMLEAWLWMDNSHVANAFGFSRYGERRVASACRLDCRTASLQAKRA